MGGLTETGLVITSFKRVEGSRLGQGKKLGKDLTAAAVEAQRSRRKLCSMNGTVTGCSRGRDPNRDL